MPVLTIRNLEENDLEAVQAIEDVSFSCPWSPQSMKEALNNEQIDCQVLLADGRLVGYFMLLHVADEAELLNIAVHPDDRSNGFGRTLLQEALSQAKTFEAATCYLEVRPSNPRAIHLYETAGFQPIGRRKKYYQNPIEDAILMACPL